MPSGPPELHTKWKNDSNAIEFLESRGYTLLKGFVWRGPIPKPDSEEEEALYYLIVEWDYGPVVEESGDE